MKIPAFFLMLFCLSTSYLAKAQIVTVSEELTIRNDIAYEIVGKMKERTLLFRVKENEYEVQAFDEKLRLSWSKELEFEKKKVDIVEVVPSPNNDEFYVIYQYRQKGHPILKIHTYDPAANLRDSITVKDFGVKLNSPNIEVIESESHRKLLLYHIEDQKDIQAFAIDLDEMEVMWEYSFQPDDWYVYRDFREVLISNAGEMFFISEKDNRSLKKAEHRFEMYFYNLRTNKLDLINIPFDDHLTYDVNFTFDNLNKQLIAAGLYSEDNRGRANGYYFLRFDPYNADARVFNFHEFDPKLVATIMEKKESKIKGLTEAKVQDIVMRRDGGILLVGERNKHYERRMVSNRTYANGAARNIVDYYYDDIFVISIHPSGESHWEKILHKRQYSQDDDAIYSSYFLLKTPSSLRFLFNDEIRQENTVSEYIIKGDGLTDRNSIFSTGAQEIRLRFRDALQVASNELLIPSQRRHKLKLVNVTY
ncbi:MAG: hypothetical protein AAFO94_06455 [Bacteroidota bacterium]